VNKDEYNILYLRSYRSTKSDHIWHGNPREGGACSLTDQTRPWFQFWGVLAATYTHTRRRRTTNFGVLTRMNKAYFMGVSHAPIRSERGLGAPHNV